MELSLPYSFCSDVEIDDADITWTAYPGLGYVHVPAYGWRYVDVLTVGSSMMSSRYRTKAALLADLSNQRRVTIYAAEEGTISFGIGR